MKLKRVLPVLGVSLFLVILFAVSACGGNKDNPAETGETGGIGTYENGSSTLRPVSDADTEPGTTDMSTEPVTTSVTEPVTQPPIKEPETLSAEEETILDALYASLQSASASDRVLYSSTATVSMDFAGTGNVTLTESSRFVCADGNYSVQITSGDINASVMLCGNFLYASTPSGGKMKAYLTTSEERELVVSSVFSGYMGDEDVLDRTFLSSLRGIKRMDSDAGTAITFDSMNKDALSSLFGLPAFGDADLSVSSAAGRFQLNQEGLPEGIAIHVACVLRVEDQTISLVLDIATVYDYSESVKVNAPDNTGTYADMSLSQLLDKLENMEIPNPEFPEIETGTETNPPETDPGETAKVRYVTANALWVRSSPIFTDDSNKIGLLYKGDKIEVLELTDTYCSFLYNGSVAYTGVRYLSETSPAP